MENPALDELIEKCDEINRHKKEKLDKEIEKMEFYSDRKLLEEIYKELLSLKINSL